MKSDTQLKSDVTSELAWDPSINATAIGVMVKDGIVTLSGHLDTFGEKHAVERAVRRVAGVRGIALDLDVKLPADHKRNDTEIAHAALGALRWHSWVPHEHLQVEVEDGWVTLSGEVDWHYQLKSAEECVRPLMGVRGLTSKITVNRRAGEQDVAAQITAALIRQAQQDARNIVVKMADGVATVTGPVHSMAEHDWIVQAASTTRGVTRVVDKLSVEA